MEESKLKVIEKFKNKYVNDLTRSELDTWVDTLSKEANERLKDYDIKLDIEIFFTRNCLGLMNILAWGEKGEVPQFEVTLQANTIIFNLDWVIGVIVECYECSKYLGHLKSQIDAIMFQRGCLGGCVFNMYG